MLEENQTAQENIFVKVWWCILSKLKEDLSQHNENLSLTLG